MTITTFYDINTCDKNLWLLTDKGIFLLIVECIKFEDESSFRQDAISNEVGLKHNPLSFTV